MSSGRSDDRWLLTASGKRFWPLDPRPEDICIKDIAHALSHICRFGGHCREPYSVAQHSMIVSSVVEPKHALYGLLHDAAEAYVGDMVGPLKRGLKEYRSVEALVQYEICKKFGISFDETGTSDSWKDVKRADEIVLITELRDLFTEPMQHEVEDGFQPLDRVIYPWGPRYAREAFLERFHQLAGVGT